TGVQYRLGVLYAPHSVSNHPIVEAPRSRTGKPFPHPSVALVTNSITELLPRDSGWRDYALCKQATDGSIPTTRLLAQPRINVRDAFGLYSTQQYRHGGLGQVGEGGFDLTCVLDLP